MFEPTNSAEGVTAPDTDVDPSTVTDIENNGTATDEGDPQLDDDGNPIVAAPDDEDEELDYEGTKFRAPKGKGIKEALLRTADYTQKTQRLAADRKAFETERASSLATHQAYIDALAEAKSIDTRLKDYADVDWAALEQVDPAAAAHHFRAYTLLKEQRAAADSKAKDAKQRIDVDAQSSKNKRAEEVRAKLPELIPGFNAEVDAKLVGYGKTFGWSNDQLVALTLQNPAAALLLHKAMQWDDHVAKQAKAKQAAKQAAGKPAAEIGGKNAGTQRRTTDASGDSLSTEEWVKRERERMRNRGKR